MYLDVSSLNRKSFLQEILITNLSTVRCWEKGKFYRRSGKEEIFRSRGPQVSHGNRGVIYRGVALDKFISISMENTLHTHNAAKPRAASQRR